MAEGRPLEASSYRPLYRVQHVIYRIGDVRLPFPVGVEAVILFFAYAVPLGVLAGLAPSAFALMGVPAFVTVPVAAALLAHASTKVEPAGKGVLAYLGGLAAYAVRPRWWVRGLPAPRVPRAAGGRRQKVVLKWRRSCGRPGRGGRDGQGAGAPAAPGAAAFPGDPPVLWGRADGCGARREATPEASAAGRAAGGPGSAGASGPPEDGVAVGQACGGPPVLWPGGAGPASAEGQERREPARLPPESPENPPVFWAPATQGGDRGAAGVPGTWPACGEAAESRGKPAQATRPKRGRPAKRSKRMGR